MRVGALRGERSRLPEFLFRARCVIAVQQVCAFGNQALHLRLIRGSGRGTRLPKAPRGDERWMAGKDKCDGDDRSARDNEPREIQASPRTIPRNESAPKCER